MVPVPEGSNVTLSVPVCPGARICPDCTPLVVYPAPAMTTFEIVISEFPVLVKATGRTLPAPTLTFGKSRLVVLAVRVDGEASTVSIAGLLVTLSSSALLLTVTANDSPFSEVVAGGVVYVAEVAPLMATPLFFH